MLAAPAPRSPTPRFVIIVSSIAAAATGLLLWGCGGDAPSPAATPARWSYSGTDGPAHWASLSPEYALCGGRSQSPIDVIDPTPAVVAPPVLAYSRGRAAVVDNGHTIEAAAAPGNTITVDGVTSLLEQAHFHARSEHRINGRDAPMEMHFVHADAAGALTVVGAMVRGGGRVNTAWQPFVAAAGDVAGEPATATLDWRAMLPTDLSSVRYVGSRTTPPCTEGVRWVLLRRPIVLGDAQIARLTAIYGDNNRPVQPLNGRRVVLGRH